MHRTLRYRLAFREFGALLGLRCYEHDDYLEARVDAITALWEDRFPEMTPEDLRPITMVMYSASILPTGMTRLLCLFRDDLGTNADVQHSKRMGLGKRLRTWLSIKSMVKV